MSIIARSLTIGALAAMGLLAGPYVFAEVPAIEDRSGQFQLPAPTPKAQAVDSDEDSSAFIIEKLNQLQQELQQLRGQLEVQAHDLKLLNEKQQAYYRDLDQRISAEKSSTQASRVVTPKPTVASTPTEALATPILSGDSAKADYDTAYGFIKDKNFDSAITMMQAFVAKYPKDTLASNAYYWLGELSLVKNNLSVAVKHFQTVVEDFPNSNKYPASLLKLGFSYYDQGDLVKAREILSKVVKRYPGSSTARLANKRLNAIDDVMR